MIALLGASAFFVTALQAGINAPTDAFRGCLKTAATKATADKVAGDAVEAYLRAACTAEMGKLKNAVISFRTKNGMGKKAAAEDADMTVEDYLATTVDKYQFMATLNAPQKQADAAPQAPAATPASAPQPPKQ